MTQTGRSTWPLRGGRARAAPATFSLDGPGPYQATELVLPRDLPVLVVRDDAGCALSQVVLPVDLPEVGSTNAEKVKVIDLHDDLAAGNAMRGWVPSTQLAPRAFPR